MSSLTINGILISSTPDFICPLCGHSSDQKGLCRVCRTSADMTPRGSAPAPVVTPSFATHRLVDGNWVPKGSAPAPVVTPKPTIGFIQPAPAVPSVPTPKGSVSFLGSRKEYLRAIEIAAGNTLLKGTNQKAIDAIRRGRLGGRKDNMSELHALLQEYSA
jgi:hypothetical protein